MCAGGFPGAQIDRCAPGCRDPSYPVGMATPEKRLSPQAARALEKREARLAEIAEQVNDGSLTVRQMTAAERKVFDARRAARPPKPRRPAR